MTISRPRTEAPRRRPPIPRYGRVGTRGGRAAFLATGPTAWYDTRDLLSTSQQTLTNRVGTSTATLGSTAGSDTNDPLALPYSGTAYVYLPGTASNNLSIVKGAWAGTLHVTATLTDDTTATFTTTADPVLIGNTLLSAGRYKKFVVRDTDGNGTVRVTIEPSVETTGQASWTCTTGQTVTVNRATSGLLTAVVTRPLLMADGTDDYLALATSDIATVTATTGSMTQMVVIRRHNLKADFQRLVSHEAAATHGPTLSIDLNTQNLHANMGGATTQVSSSLASAVPVDGTLVALSQVVAAGSTYGRSTATGTSSTPVSTTGVGSISYSANPRVGNRVSDGNHPGRYEFFAVVLWRRALTDAELDTAATYLLGSYS